MCAPTVMCDTDQCRNWLKQRLFTDSSSREVSLVCVDGIKDNQITIPWPSSLQILCHLLGVGTWDSQVSQLQIRPDHGRLGNFPQQCHTIINMEISRAAAADIQ